MLSQELISELKNVLTNEYNLNITNEETEQFGNKILNYFEILIKSNYEHTNQNSI